MTVSKNSPSGFESKSQALQDASGQKPVPKGPTSQGPISQGRDMWGARFSAGPDALMQAINASIDTDRHLYREDIEGSKAHARMLAAQNIISTQDLTDIIRGLDQIKAEIEAGDFTYDPALEDIHMHIEARLTALIGEAGKRLHTARSRNDQVATDFRLFLRARTDEHLADILKLIKVLLDQADAHTDTILPGFTHLQSAQPVTFGHHLMAYVEMLGRDKARLEGVRARLNESPLGAAALAGTGFDIDRFHTSRALGFDRPMRNSLDAVSARDFALDYLSALTILSVHLSRFAEEIVLWASEPFSFIRISDQYSTGSSIMPQKRNPDAAELVRAKSGKMAGSLQALILVMKGLPLAYSKDMQEDKASTMAASADMQLTLAVMAGMLDTMTVNTDTMRAAALKGHITATDLADGLVRELGMPFRDAHHVTGQAVKYAEEKGLSLHQLTLTDLQTIDARINETIVTLLTLDASVCSRTSFGGTAPDLVKSAIKETRERLGL